MLLIATIILRFIVRLRFPTDISMDMNAAQKDLII